MDNKERIIQAAMDLIHEKGEQLESINLHEPHCCGSCSASMW